MYHGRVGTRGLQFASRGLQVFVLSYSRPTPTGSRTSAILP